MQTTLTVHCVGAAGIQKCKEAFLVNGRSLVVCSRSLPEKMVSEGWVLTGSHSISPTPPLWQTTMRLRLYMNRGVVLNRPILLRSRIALSSSTLSTSNRFAVGTADQCSSYKTQYTVFKPADNQTVQAAPILSLEPQAQVYWYHDIYVNPAALISDIPCDSLT